MSVMEHSIDPRNGYCSTTKTFHSLRESTPLPPETTPLSITDYVFSLLQSDPSFSLSSPLIIDSDTRQSLSYDFLHRVDSLSYSLFQHHYPPLSFGTVALVLSPPSFHVPVLYFSLLSLGVVVSPANPLSTHSELIHLLELAKPSVIFTVSSLTSKLTSCSSDVPIFLLDSPEFNSMLTHRVTRPRVPILQSSSGMTIYSSGTTGRVKGAELTHRNLIALPAELLGLRRQALEKEGEKKGTTIYLLFLPLFHIFGFLMFVRAAAMAETLVLMAKFDFEKMLETVEKHKITYLPATPQLVMVLEKSKLTKKYDLSSLETIGCGGAPLTKEVALRFKARFPNVTIIQGYGMTEAGGISSTSGPGESERYGSVGRLYVHVEA